jgi:hypothetical protein
VSQASNSGSSRRATVRFAVGDPTGPQSSVWRLWTRGNDVYISLRDLTKAKKVSLHSSGRWRNAWTTEHVAKGSPFVAPGQDRATDKWDRPPEFSPGVTRAFDIVVPASEVTNPKVPDADTLSGKKIVWVTPPPRDYATHFTVLFTTAEVTAATSGWPGRRSMGTQLIWKAELPNRETVWLVALERPVDDWVRQIVTGFKRSALPEGRCKMEEAGYSEVDDARAIIYVRNEQPRMRGYIDISGEDLQG